MVVSEQTEARIDADLSEDGDTLTIHVSGYFDFNLHRDFQHAYQNYFPPPKQYRIDLSETLHIDSAALGMLLLLRDHCLGDGDDPGQCTVELCNANAHVETILQVSNFNKLFTIR
ncbi:STAS domain-containing protein [Microbulbifer sp. SAOS-129_SWC]|uniref:STAS domain-containing protein n=1 Tax=Microbulbifer sp. SAOS-129_SWC TaxID=3145235 RepID=UPI0032179A4B